MMKFTGLNSVSWSTLWKMHVYFVIICSSKMWFHWITPQNFYQAFGRSNKNLDIVFYCNKKRSEHTVWTYVHLVLFSLNFTKKSFVSVLWSLLNILFSRYIFIYASYHRHDNFKNIFGWNLPQLFLPLERGFFWNTIFVTYIFKIKNFQKSLNVFAFLLRE